jgi:hypothetical protein
VVPLIVLMVWIGVKPDTFLRRMSPSVSQLLSTVREPKDNKALLAHRRIPSAAPSTMMPAAAPDVTAGKPVFDALNQNANRSEATR